MLNHVTFSAARQWPFEGAWATWSRPQLGMTSALEQNTEHVPCFIHTLGNKPQESIIQALRQPCPRL